ncbi:hypothetical protein B0H14DRAFT_2976515 [Mycena olivaceomarginata]|nr:hypothetical protein B0H14DRAFT_2976515 [Mycena olivaceomarginata]
MPLLSIFSFCASRVFPILMSVSLVLSLCNFSPSPSFFLSLLPPPSPSLSRSFLPAHPPLRLCQLAPSRSIGAAFHSSGCCRLPRLLLLADRSSHQP